MRSGRRPQDDTYYVLNINIKIPIASFIPIVVVANVPDTMSSDDTKPFRERLRMLREAKGLSQTKLEERIGKEANYITRVETGRIMPSVGRNRPNRSRVRYVCE